MKFSLPSGRGLLETIFEVECDKCKTKSRFLRRLERNKEVELTFKCPECSHIKKIKFNPFKEMKKAEKKN